VTDRPDHDPHVLGPGLAPTPFTAAEIRDFCRTGRLITTVVETDGVTTTRTSRYLAADAEGGTIEYAVLAPDGSVLSTEVEAVTWAQLQSHAAFPADRTTVDRELLDLPTGPAECLRYTVAADGVTRRLWFDTARPGMPVRVETEEAGVVTGVRTVVADERLLP
jgi:hypothetical protein